MLEKVASGLGALMAIAIMTRIAWELMAPAVPLLLVSLALTLIFKRILGPRRW